MKSNLIRHSSGLRVMQPKLGHFWKRRTMIRRQRYPLPSSFKIQKLDCMSNSGGRFFWNNYRGVAAEEFWRQDNIGFCQLFQEGTKYGADWEKSVLLSKRDLHTIRETKDQNPDASRCSISGRSNHGIVSCRFRNHHPNQHRRNSSMAVFSFPPDVHSETEWLTDSGATCHMTNIREWLQEFRGESLMEVTTANNEVCVLVRFLLNFKRYPNTNKVSNVMCISKLAINFKTVMKNGFKVARRPLNMVPVYTERDYFR